MVSSSCSSVLAMLLSIVGQIATHSCELQLVCDHFRSLSSQFLAPELANEDERSAEILVEQGVDYGVQH